MMLDSPLPIANLGEMGKSCEWVLAVGKTRERQRELEKPQGYSNSENNPEAKVV